MVRTPTSVKSLNILYYVLLVPTVSLSRWHHHSRFWIGRDLGAVETV